MIQIAAKYAGKCLKINNTSSENRPKGSIVYEDKDVHLNDGTAIAYFLSNPQLKGSNIFEQSQVLQYTSIADNHILPSVCGWVLPSLKSASVKNSKDSINEAKNNLQHIMDAMNKTLLDKTYLVGERISLADIGVFSALMPAYENVFDSEMRKKYSNVSKWFETILHQPNVKSVVGDFKYYEKK